MEFDGTFLIAAISFVVFVFIMNGIFYAPVLKIMKERGKIVEDNFKDAEILKVQIKEKEEYHNSELEASREHARNELSSAMQRMKSEKTKIIAEYKAELQQKEEEEKESLTNSAVEAGETLKDKAAAIAKDISNILLGADIDADMIGKSQIEAQIKEDYGSGSIN